MLKEFYHDFSCTLLLFAVILNVFVILYVESECNLL